MSHSFSSAGAPGLMPSHSCESDASSVILATAPIIAVKPEVNKLQQKHFRVRTATDKEAFFEPERVFSAEDDADMGEF